ncbi:hypothetical protein AAF712_014372 [Marasmius tenuissimus]|uniref:Uncharacterized protein n=1 Tax=Marasmius tenuissimus TaxID=585030 RepID=A0ABR2ZD63_9AGAR
MSRPKLYTTEAQRREANRIKNKRFYDQNRLKILDSKHNKRVQERHAQEQDEIQERKKRRERSNREKKGGLTTGIEPLEESISPTPVNIEKEIEDRLEALKGQYQTRVPSGQRQFLHDLSQEALQWKHSQRGAIMTRPLSPSPVIAAKKAIDSMLDEYHDLANYYFDCLHKRKGQVWEEKREVFWAFEEVLSKMLSVLDNMNELLALDGYNPSLEDFSDLYIHQFQY